MFTCSRSGVFITQNKIINPQAFLYRHAGDLWLIKLLSLCEKPLWWVEPDYRDGTIGGKLFHKSLQVCKELKKRGLIQGYTMTLMDQSPQIKLEKYGFKPIETIYYAE